MFDSAISSDVLAVFLSLLWKTFQKNEILSLFLNGCSFFVNRKEPDFNTFFIYNFLKITLQFMKTLNLAGCN